MSFRTDDLRKDITAFLLWRSRQPEMTDDDAVAAFVKERVAVPSVWNAPPPDATLTTTHGVEGPVVLVGL